MSHRGWRGVDRGAGMSCRSLGALRALRGLGGLGAPPALGRGARGTHVYCHCAQSLPHRVARLESAGVRRSGRPTSQPGSPRLSPLQRLPGIGDKLPPDLFTGQAASRCPRASRRASSAALVFALVRKMRGKYQVFKTIARRQDGDGAALRTQPRRPVFKSIPAGDISNALCQQLQPR